MNTLYCQACGTKLSVTRSITEHWTEYFKCKNCRNAYLQVGDTRSIFHLCTIHSRKAQQVLEHGTNEELTEAFDALIQVDSYSVATEEFENTLDRFWFKDIVKRNTEPALEP